MSRQKSNIQWDEIEDLIVSGCSVREIAGYCGCSERTIYDRCQTDNNETYSSYSQKKRAKGDTLLRAHQFAKALGKTDKGDNTLLIWLGKQRLDQREKPKEEELEDVFVRRLAQAIKDLDGISRVEKSGFPNLEIKPSVLDQGCERKEDNI